ncbi:uncharacterized protein LOC130954059 isoform X2 [Arachis stenosperma]|uniref:uncharacterized protein LOC130954059 isoform X2 n=1 Tax=Arachis stenosperma TaxID=217475 RepID=UPI0025AC171F|nr:uncharacterized protein LOC130954059 isoform X2 [Arachis stenosperma]
MLYIFFPIQMEKLLYIMFHHGGTFKKNADGKLVYSPDNRACLGDLDEDTLDVFFIRNYFKELGYDKVVECWWLVSERILEVGLRALTIDDELREMCFHAQRNDGVVDVYFEHGVSTPELLEGKEDVLCLDYIQQEEPGGELNKKNTPEDTLNESNSTNPATSAADIPPPVYGPQAEEVELSQPSYGGIQDEAPPPPATRPPKLPTKRKTTPQPVTTSVDPMQGASAATSSRLARFMKMVPTPHFKAPRKKNP